VSKSEERDVILGHEDEADGIQEYDNPLPDWWVGLFWITIIWSFGYLVHYHFIADRSPQAALARELVEAEQRWPEGLAAAGVGEFEITDDAVTAGRQVFQTNCVACHGANMEGGIGPNLLDDEWIHGGTPEAVIDVITNGVVEKGMLAWGPILGAEAVRSVAAYVLARNAESVGGAASTPAQAQADTRTTAATAAEFAVTPDAVAAGQQTFQTYCVACHGPNLEGGIGPNLVDDEWIHGGTSADIIRTITNGVPEKGMVAWGPVLGANGVNEVAAYVVSKNAAALGRDPGN
jgi:cytochrome c oxidase cbb3-type subunit 3